MPEATPNVNLLYAMRDLGLPEPLTDAIDQHARGALAREFESTRSGRRRGRLPFGWVARRAFLLPAALLVTAAVAAAASGVLPIPNMLRFAQQNANDSALALFQKSVPFQGGTARYKGGPIIPFKETVIPSTVSQVGSFTLAGVGTVQYWAATTQQHGVCTALQLPDGSWAPLKDLATVGGAIPGCSPTRVQVGRGALILDGFDYGDVPILGSDGQRWDVYYGYLYSLPGATVSGAAVSVRDPDTGLTVPVLDGRYFALPLHPQEGANGSVWGNADGFQALNAAGQVIATAGTPLPGTPS